MIDLPRMALSIRQPWAYLIANGLKDIENRDWRTSFRGPFAIHAGKAFDREALRHVVGNIHPVTGENGLFLRGMPPDFVPMGEGKMNGGIVGVAEVVDCVEVSDSEWFVGAFGFVIANARPIKMIPCSGRLGFFDWRRRLEPDSLAEAAE